MDGRERESYPRYDDPRPPRLRSSSSASGRRGSTSPSGRFQEDLELSDDPPAWSERFGGTRRGPSSAEERMPERRPRRDQVASPQTASQRSRASRPIDDVIDERPRDTTGDPYDRLRRVTERRGRSTSSQSADLPELAELDADRHELDRPSRRLREADAIRRPTRPPMARPQLQAMGSMLARSSQDMGPLTQLAALAVGSTLALAMLTVARIGSTSDWLVIRLDASGEPTRWASNDVLWRLPLLVLFATVAGLVVAWKVRRHDAFAAQFTLVAILLLHGFGWVAAGRLLF